LNSALALAGCLVPVPVDEQGLDVALGIDLFNLRGDTVALTFLQIPQLQSTAV
jgi:hypothetical protein